MKNAKKPLLINRRSDILQSKRRNFCGNLISRTTKIIFSRELISRLIDILKFRGLLTF